MIEIDITTNDHTSRRALTRFEAAAETLADLVTEELVKEARKRAPISLRTSIQRRRMGQGWRVQARDEAAEGYIEDAMESFDWRGAFRRLLGKVS